MAIFSSLRLCSGTIFFGVALLSAQGSNAVSATRSGPHKAVDLQQILSIFPGLDTRYPMIRESPGLLENITEFLEDNSEVPKEELEAALRKFLCERGYTAFCCSACYTSTTTSSPTTSSQSTQPGTTDSATTGPSSTAPATTEPASTQPSSTEPASTQPSSTQPSSSLPASRACTTPEAPPAEEPCKVTITTTVDCFVKFLYKILPILQPTDAQTMPTHLRGAHA